VVPHREFVGLTRLPFYIVLGVSCGLLGVLITRGAFFTEDLFARLPVRRFWHPLLGAGVVALIGLAVPRALGVGYSAISATLLGQLSVGALAAVFTAKLVMWCIAIGSGTSGSSLAPLMLVGASGGGLLGMAIARLVPGAGISPAAFGIVGLAATFGAAAGAPFTSIALAFEITRDYNLILPLMFATVIAHLLARSLYPETLMTEKLARRGILVSQRYQVGLERVTPVSKVMDDSPATVSPDSPVNEVQERLRQSGRHAVVVATADRVIGILTEGDVLRRPRDHATTVGDIASKDLLSVKPGTTVFEASQRLLHEGVRQLPVIEDGKLRGMFSRLDALRVSELEVAEERPQAGWHRGSRPWRWFGARRRKAEAPTEVRGHSRR
ncbi:MAG TPA: chloride channel protein, partial [Actinomycetota bacterium]|nr:chloride channel protein [Actinomycetota bacterium]